MRKLQIISQMEQRKAAEAKASNVNKLVRTRKKQAACDTTALVLDSDKLNEVELAVAEKLAEGYSRTEVIRMFDLPNAKYLEGFFNKPQFVAEYNRKVRSTGTADNTQRILQKRIVTDALFAELQNRLKDPDQLKWLKTVDLAQLASHWANDLEKSLGPTESDVQMDLISALTQFIAMRHRSDLKKVAERSKYPVIEGQFVEVEEAE